LNYTKKLLWSAEVDGPSSPSLPVIKRQFKYSEEASYPVLLASERFVRGGRKED
jgi:hypothetical protein